MRKKTLFTAAALLLAVSLALIVYGLQAETPWLWHTGLWTIVLAMILSLASHWSDRGRRKE
ncbi:MAG: hypothetical protein AB1805_15300 [Nitrospirota bacterium]